MSPDTSQDLASYCADMNKCATLTVTALPGVERLALIDAELLQFLYELELLNLLFLLLQGYLAAGSTHIDRMLIVRTVHLATAVITFVSQDYSM